MPSTWLDEINMLELSAVRRPANLKRKLLTKSEDDMPELWIKDQTIEELFKAASLTDAQKAAIRAALGELNKAKPGMDDELFKGAHGALAKLLGFGATQKQIDEAVEQVKKTAEEDRGKLVEVVKTAVTKLEGDKPPVSEVIVSLAELANITPTIKRLDALPPELKNDWEALVKSREADRKELLELKKSLAAKEQQATHKEFVVKAKTELTHVPMKPEALADLMLAVADNEEVAKGLDALLKSVNELVTKSAAFKELGGSKELPPDNSGVVGKIEAMAQQMVQKSEKPLTKEQAFTKVLEQNPELYNQYIAAQNA